jgi:UDP-N-acetylmuramate--alanine ligase
VRNSLSALAAVHCHALKNHLDVQPVLQAVAQALSTFSGTGRRFDLRGEVDGITVIDDYAHHPTEIQATLAAARARYPQRRIWALWQPHTFSRTRTLMDAFCNSFQDADQVIVTEVYAAREQAQDFDNFSAAQVVQHMAHPAVQFVPTLTAAGDALLQALRPGDVLLVLSAGDADQVSARILQELPQAKQVRRP